MKTLPQVLSGRGIDLVREHDAVRHVAVVRGRQHLTASRFLIAPHPVLLETSDDGNATGPQIATDARGNPVAVWHQYSGAQAHIWSNRYTPSAGWLGAEVRDTNPYSATNPQVEVDELGNVIAVWQQGDGTFDRIWSSRYASGIWSAPEVIDTNSVGAGRDPQVAMNAFGKAVAVWLQYDGAYLSVRSNRYTPSGGWAIAEPLESNDGNASEVRVGMDARGNAIVVWQKHDGTRNNIWSNSLR